MMKKIIKALVGKEVITKLSEDMEKLRKMNITDMAFYEFMKRYFKVCSPYPEYLEEVWPNVVKIKKAIMPTSLIRKGVTFN